MMYLQGKTHDYTRTDLLPVAYDVPGSTGRGRGAASAAGGQAASAAGWTERRGYGEPGAAGPVRCQRRRASVDRELGKMAFDMKVDYAVRQIREAWTEVGAGFSPPGVGPAEAGPYVCRAALSAASRPLRRRASCRAG